MALITSDCGAMRLPEHQMALITSFFDQLVHRFVGASTEQVTKLGWDMIFNKYDDDCSGGLDKVEFAQVRDPATWTTLQHDGSNHLGLWCNMIPEYQMALITSGYGSACGPSAG